MKSIKDFFIDKIAKKQAEKAVDSLVSGLPSLSKEQQQDFEEMLEKSESIKKYIDAKKEFDAMVNQVNQMLNFYITGQDPNCTHDCSTCGGCH